MEKVTNNKYRGKYIFEKVGKCPLDLACILIFHIQNGSTIFQKYNLNL